MAGRDGFTLMELVVTVVLLGILVSVSIPAYNGVAEETQGKRNEANMQTIREAFFHYYYRMHQTSGRSAHFPPAPTNETRVMDDEWTSTPMDSTRSPQAPKHLFSKVKCPKTPIIIPSSMKHGRIRSLPRVRSGIISR